MSADYMVKGTSIRTKFDYVRERFGEDAHKALRDGFRHRKDLFPVLDSSWYPFALYDELITRIAQLFHAGRLDGLRDAGSYSAEKALTSVYRSFTRAKDLGAFLSRVGELHGTYYNLGQMSAEMAADGRSCSVRMQGAPAYTEADGEVAAGFLLGAARLMGKTEARCTRRPDGRGVSFRLEW